MHNPDHDTAKVTLEPTLIQMKEGKEQAAKQFVTCRIVIDYELTSIFSGWSMLIWDPSWSMCLLNQMLTYESYLSMMLSNRDQLLRRNTWIMYELFARVAGKTIRIVDEATVQDLQYTRILTILISEDQLQ